jgi:hypothetical protein
MNKKTKDLIENIVLGAIFLVLVQTFIEDFAVIRGWSWNVRKILIVSGFCFDLFFTIEFLIRLYAAMAEGKVREYLVLRRGWIDLLASIPLLLLNSGPSAYAVILGGAAIGGAAGILNVLKVVKAVRIARILRLLRVLKIFKQIKNTDSEMAQRHVSKITTMGVSLFVFVLLIFSIFSQLTGMPSADLKNEKVMVDVIMAYTDGKTDGAEMYSDLLIVKKKGETVFTRFDNDYYSDNFGFEDYQFAEYMDYQFFFDTRDIEKIQSKDNLMFFIIIVFLVIGYTLVYSPHFAITVSDPIHVMRRGLEEKSYNFEVKIDPDYREDDLFRLAEDYNNIFLPMKDRSQAEEEVDADSLELKMDDIKNMF